MIAWRFGNNLVPHDPLEVLTGREAAQATSYTDPPASICSKPRKRSMKSNASYLSSHVIKAAG